jgi:L-asparaginase II
VRSLVDECEPVAVTDRSGFDESVHHGVAVGLSVDGAVAVQVGDPSVPVYGRSANKPMQADAMLRSGLAPTPEQLALVCASHDGTERHVAVVRELLAAAGLGEAALRNTPGLPLHEPSADRVLAAGGRGTSMLQNCSGKHAGMLATCVAQGWDTADYLAIDHPLQLAITDRIVELAGDVVHVGVDGCGAPAHVMPLIGLAWAVRALAVERGAVWAAMTAHPDLVGGDDRVVTRLMRAVPGLMAKDGAEGVLVAAHPDGRAAAVKIADGAARAAGVVLASVFVELGVEVDPASLGAPILGHGEPVGRVRSTLPRR